MKITTRRLALCAVLTALALGLSTLEGMFPVSLLIPLPGIKLGMQALFTGTAQLPDVRIEAPAHVICTETVESLQAGAVYGAAAMTDGLVERMESELGRPCTAVVTGGLGRFVVPHCRRRLVYDEHLLLRGLGMIWRRAQGEIHSCGAMGNAV